MKTTLIKVAVLFLIVLAAVLTICGINGLLTEQCDQSKVLRVLCDAFFVPGVVLLCISGLSWASDKGAFDALGYGIFTFFNTHMPAGKGLNWRKKETYQEYIERKHPTEKKKKKLNVALIFGGVLLVVSVALLIAYLNVK